MNIKKKVEKIHYAVDYAGAKAMLAATNKAEKLNSKKIGKMLLILPLAISMLTISVCAAGGSGSAADADSFITQVVDLLKIWIPRLGGMIVVVGGIQFGIGFKDDDTTGKTRGMQTMIGGAIVAAIGGIVQF